MDSARIAGLLRPFLGEATLSSAQLDYISTYIDILLRWNARINLTAIRDPEEIVTRHFGESLFAARHLFPSGRAALQPRVTAEEKIGPSTPEFPSGRAALQRRVSTAEKIGPSTSEFPSGRAALQRRVSTAEQIGASAPEGTAIGRFQPALGETKGPTTNDQVSLADVGAGAGFPGIPIKLWNPHIALTLIESNQKKAVFLREVTRALTLTDINIRNSRAEDLLHASLKPDRAPQDLRDHDLAQPSHSVAEQPGSTGRDAPPGKSNREFGPPFEVVTLRAVERFPNILPVVASLVARGGRIALLIGSPQVEHAVRSVSAFQWLQPIPIPLSTSRVLLIGVGESRK